MAILFNEGNQCKVTFDNENKMGIFDDLFDEVNKLDIPEGDKNRIGGKVCVAAIERSFDEYKIKRAYRKGFNEGFDKGFIVGVGVVVTFGIGAGLAIINSKLKEKHKKKTYIVHI